MIVSLPSCILGLGYEILYKLYISEKLNRILRFVIRFIGYADLDIIYNSLVEYCRLRAKRRMLLVVDLQRNAVSIALTKMGIFPLTHNEIYLPS